MTRQLDMKEKIYINIYTVSHDIYSIYTVYKHVRLYIHYYTYISTS